MQSKCKQKTDANTMFIMKGYGIIWKLHKRETEVQVKQKTIQVVKN